MKEKKLSVSSLCLIGIFTAIIAVSAQISIPMPYGVPMTLQTFAIPFVGIVLGAKKGTLATSIYVLLGALGIPVFAGFTGGLGIVFGPTGGFILSFPIMALAAGIGAGKNNKMWIAVGIVAGTIINYLCGMFMYSIVMSSDLKTAFAVCIAPFVPTAVIKAALAGVSGVKIKSILEKAKLGA